MSEAANPEGADARSPEAEERTREIVRWLPAGIGNRYRTAILDSIREAELAAESRGAKAALERAAQIADRFNHGTAHLIADSIRAMAPVQEKK